MSARKTVEQRANEVINKFRDWNNRHVGVSTEKRRLCLYIFIYKAIISAQQSTADAVHYGPKRIRPPAPREFPAFPFADHRTLAQVDQAKEPA